MATNYSNILLRFDGKATLARGTTPVRVRGSNGADTVAIDRGVEAVLDGSFNRGNDVVNFVGLASTYTVSALNSSSILVTDAQGTSVTIPVGTNGITINFADASRALVGGVAGITLGTQTVAAAPAAVLAGSGVVAPFAPNDEVGLIPGASPSQVNTVVLVQGAQVNLGEGTDPTVIRGSNGIDVVEVTAGNVLILDGSFNRGNDTVKFDGLAEDYQIVRNGSSSVVITDEAGTSVTIPVGVNGMAIEFADVTRLLVGGANGLFLGDQQVTSVPTDIADGDTGLADNFHTLTPVVTAGTEGTPPEYAVFWGYNPNGTEDDNSTEGPSDGGIPLSELVAFVTTITGLDLAELGLIDDDGMGPFDNVTNLTVSNATTLTGSVEDAEGGAPGSSVLTISFADGTEQQFNIEAQIADKYFDFLNGLLFDSEGNSRLYLSPVPGTGTEGTSSEILPIVLTPTENNGGTIEGDVTSRSDDTIVAGRLELLHGAYIDGGAGYNVLEVEAKGVFAQPLELLNIQEVRVTDLPNFYTDENGDSVYPFISDGASTNDSFLDLSRAGQIELLIVSDQGNDFDETDPENFSGNLTIVGVRNGATLRLEGAFNSGSTTIQYADVDPAGLTVQLNIGDVNEDINILQNSAVLNIESQGVSNYLQNFFAGGSLTNLNISGTGRFGTDSDLDASFEDETPVFIDASANSGGVDLTLSGSQNVAFVGSSGDDRFTVVTSEVDGGSVNDETVTITGGEGDNYYQVTGADIVNITNGDGNNNYEVSQGTSAGLLTIVAGDGDNKYEIAGAAAAVITAGDGANFLELTSQDSFDYNAPGATPDWVSNVEIDFGNGNNRIYVQSDTNSISPDAGVVTITVGTGSNEIAAAGRVIDITTGGSGPNTIAATGEAITIDNASSSGSTIVLGGAGSDFSEVISELGGNDPEGLSFTPPRGTLEPTVLLNVQAGTGATVLLGLETNESLGGTLTALPGSVISGTDLTLEVRTVADMRAADLNGVTSVVLDDDNFDLGESTDANNAVAGGNASVLILTDTQFLEIGAENFSVDGAIFNTHAFVKIIVTQSTSLTALGVDELPRNIDLILEVQDGVTLTMTAQQLHTRVAQNGVTLSNDGNTDVASGKVVINGGGINFDPFNTSDTVQTLIPGIATYFGGSLSDDFKGTSGQFFNVSVNSVFGGYDRPSDVAAEVFLTIDSDITGEVGPFTTFQSNLLIVGSDDVVFTGPVNLGVSTGTSAALRPFTIDFSDLEGEVVNFVVDGFERLAQGGGIFGNTDNVGEVEVLVSIAADDGTGILSAESPNFGWDEAGAGGLVSQGVTQYTVVTIEGSTSNPDGSDATIVLCDKTEDLEVIALRGNWNDTLIIEDAAWGLGFELQGGGTLKAEGPTGTSNVGELDATFMFPGADAVVNIVHSVAGDTRPIFAAGITIDNADTLTITAPEGDVTIGSVSGNGLEELTVSGSGDVTIDGDLPTTLETIDFSGVDGEASFALDNPAENGITIVGAAGGSTISLDDVEAGDIASIAGAGPIALVIGEDDGGSTPTDQPVDLSSTTLTNVTSVVLEDGATLILTLAQAAAIGAENFSVAPGGDASLVLEDLGEQPFAVADFADGIEVAVVNVVDQPVVTLNPATDLTGVGSLAVPEGVTLNLTAAQFQQLAGSGTITIIDTDGNTANDAINVNITDLTQADENAVGGFDVSDVDVGLGSLSITLAESVVFNSTADDIFEGANGEKAIINIGDGLKLTLAEVEQVDGMTINGGTGSTLEFTDTSGFLVSVNASGLDVDFLRLPALLVSGNNVDFMFQGLLETVTKVIYEGIGNVDGRAQLVVVEEGVTIFGDVSFNEYLLDAEVTDLVVDLQGGTLIGGDLIFSTVQVNGSGTVDLVPAYLQTLTINSSGDGANTINGDTANVIEGNVTPGAFGPAVGIGSRTNQLKEVVINATQALEIGGSIIFSSHGDDAEGTLGFEPNDLITANDDDSAIATLVVNGTSDVTIGLLDTSDGDIDGLEVVNNSTGTLSVTLDQALIQSTDNLGQTTDDALSFTGNDTELTVVGPVDLSDDVITAVTQITIAEGSTLTISQEQFDAIGAAGIIDGGPNGNAGLVINNFDGGPFDITDLDPNIDVTLVTADADTTLVGDFTGVSIQVLEGNTLTLTAAQYNQIANSGGTITVVDGPDGGAGVGSINVVITDLTQADIDNGADNFDLGSITVGSTMVGMDVVPGSVTISLADDTVDLGTFVNFQLQAGSAADILTSDGVKAGFTLTDGQTLGVVNLAQTGTSAAPNDNGRLVVEGTGDTALVYRFVPTPALFFTQIDASGYDVTEVRVLENFFGVGQQNVEYTLDDLANDVTLVLFPSPSSEGFLDETFREVVIEADSVVPATLFFNDFDPDDEVRTLDITLEGNVTVNGGISIPTRTDKDGGVSQQFFDTLVIRSEGDSPNQITGDINTAAALGGANTNDNNLLNVIIEAAQDLIIGNDATAPFVFSTGTIRFNSVDIAANNATATLAVSGEGDVFLKGLDTTEAIGGTAGDIATLVVSNAGPGTLTVTGGSDAIELGDNTSELVFLGDGNIVLDTNTGMDTDMTANNGIDGNGLELIDASEFTGNLTLGVIEDVDNQSFTLIAGSGVTTATLIDTGLDSTQPPAGPSGDTLGWVIDYSDAAVGSQFRLNVADATLDPDSKLTINMGPNGVLYIDGPIGSTVDLSELVLDINTVQAIVLADEVELILTAEQADGLTIVAGPNAAGGSSTAFGTVNIVGLTDDPDGPAAFDLSGIAANIAGTITFAAGENDVTLDPATDLGFFGITLQDLAGSNASLAGQTIRFTTFDQADGRTIDVIDDGAPGSSSTNVIWLFESIPATVDTGDYSDILGRLWLTDALITSEGGDIEQLFTTLPNSILRVDFSSLTELDILLQSAPVDRIVEFVHFTELGDLTFNDVGATPDEFIQSLDLRLGGDVTIGDILLDDVVVDPANTDVDAIEFLGLTINSFRAVQTGEILAAEQYINDNDGTSEVGEFAKPDAPNVVGDIGVGAGDNILDLLQVTINTNELRTNNVENLLTATGGNASNVRGEALIAGTITFDAEDAGSVANADLTGANAITVKSFDYSDPDFTALVVDASLHTGLLTVTGGSPAIDAGATGESFLLATGGLPFGDDLNDVLDVALGTALDTVNGVPFAGIAGAELSVVEVTGDGDVDLGVIALVDSNDDLATDINGDGDTLDLALNEGANIAFTLQGNGVNSTTAVLGEANVNGVVTAPTLEADSTWLLRDATVTITGDVTFEDDSNLELRDVAIIIEGVVDLSEVNLAIFGGTTISVPAGNTLILSFAQLQQLDMVNITGEGTLEVVGEIPDGVDVNAGGHIFTVGVDISGITLPATNVLEVVSLTLTQPIDDDGDLGGLDNDLGHVVTGSPFNDTITTGTGSDTIDGGEGNDDYSSIGGADTFIASADDNTAAFLETDDVGTPDQRSDVLVVASGASVVGELDGPVFIATAETVNNGTATVQDTDTNLNKLIDLSAATGSNGFTIIGGDLAANTIIGSARGDIINGGDTDQQVGDRDILTGGLGADTFVFNIDISDPADFTVFEAGATYDGQATNDAEDYERIDIDTGAAATGPALVVSYRLNNTISSINVSTAGVDTTNQNEVAQAIANAFDALLLVEATTAAGDDTNDHILFTAIEGNSFEFLGIGPVPTFSVGGITSAEVFVGPGSDADDVEQVSFLDIDLGNGTATAGERYNLTIQLRDGTVVVTDDYVANGTEDEEALRDAILTGLQDKLALIGNPIVATDYDDLGDQIFGIRLEGVADAGGFTITDFLASGSFNGSGASATLTGGVGDLANADIITDLTPGDLIDLGLVAGTGGLGGNIAFDTGSANYGAAYAAANTALGAGTVYYFSSILFDLDGDAGTPDEEIGLLFFDANNDGTADGVVILPEIDEAEFNASFIIA